MSVTINGTNGLTFNDASTQNTAATGFGFKNRLMNGGVNIWQRGTSFTNTANSYQYTADRWFVFGGTSLPAASSQVATSLQNFPFALRVQRPNGNTSTANTSACQVIETVNCRDLASQTVTVSFLARAGANYSPTGSSLGVWLATGSGTDQGAQNMINSAWTSQAYAQSSVTLTTSFQQFSVTFTVPSGTNEVGLLFITFPTGTAGANDWFDVTGVQLEKGSTATSFDYRPYTTELALCQRYFQRIDGFAGMVGSGVTTVAYGTILFPVPMRASPSLSASAAIKLTDTAADYTQSSASAAIMLGTRVSPTAVEFQLANFTGMTALRPVLSVPNETGALLFPAEL